MDLMEYMKQINSIGIVSFRIKGQNEVRLHLVPAAGKVDILTWTIFVNGRFPFTVEANLACVFHEFSILVNKTMNHEYERKELLILGKNATSRAMVYITDTVDSILEGEFMDTLNECISFAQGRRLKKKLSRITLYKYSKLYERPYRVEFHVPSDLKSDSMVKIYNHLVDNHIIAMDYYGDEAIDSNGFLGVLSYSNAFVQSYHFEHPFLSQELALRLKKAGLNQIYIPLSALESLEYRISGNQFKDTLFSIKNAIHAGLDVIVESQITKNNTDYFSLVQFCHQHKVKRFRVSFDENVEDKEIILKRAYYYTKLYNLELELLSTKVIPTKQLSRMEILAPYADEGIVTYSMDMLGNFYASREMNMGIGNIVKTKITDMWETKEAKTVRKETLRRFKNETKNQRKSKA